MKTFDEFEHEMSDLTDAGSLPAFAVEEAEAKEIEKRQREEFILNITMGFLFFIPFVGLAGGDAIAAGVRSLIRLIGVAGEVGMTVYGVISGQDNAFMTVFSALIGAGFGRGGFRSAANSRRGMDSTEYNSLGNPKPKLATVNNLRGGMCSL
ncbi:hypothetical protein C8A05DRAFT_34550 [Staphylotrichum tortipilum]|uniref:Uncharacterized protein n=1 Tax=Staphylotrichum tortipilum TaxID=2831512 RepID=A0AAN6MKJ5_9PEZI|nr:hypothetical protein C8A05DRAFT_34550 [Staphylotrichum longicolle]